MAQSLSKVILHIVFSTKYRRQLIVEEVQPMLYAYIAGICKKNGSYTFQVGGISNHMHIACTLPRTMTIADLVQDIKQSSSRWIKNQHPECKTFEWQKGYGVFSIGQRHLDGLIRYIKNQKQHHNRYSCKNEFRNLLDENKINYDETFLWD